MVPAVRGEIGEVLLELPIACPRTVQYSILGGEIVRTLSKWLKLHFAGAAACSPQCRTDHLIGLYGDLY